MAYYQFSLPMNVRDSFDFVFSVCERAGCTFKWIVPDESIDLRPKVRWRTPLQFILYFAPLDDGTEITVSTHDKTVVGALESMNKNKTEVIWDLSDKEWSDLIESFRAEMPSFPLKSGRPTPVAAIPYDDGLAQESVSAGKNISLGRAAAGGMLFGETGALVGGLSGTKQFKTQTRNVFSSTVLFQVIYSNGRVIDRVVKKNSREYAELMSKRIR